MTLVGTKQSSIGCFLVSTLDEPSCVPAYDTNKVGLILYGSLPNFSEKYFIILGMSKFKRYLSSLADLDQLP